MPGAAVGAGVVAAAAAESDVAVEVLTGCPSKNIDSRQSDFTTYKLLFLIRFMVTSLQMNSTDSFRSRLVRKLLSKRPLPKFALT